MAPPVPIHCHLKAPFRTSAEAKMHTGDRRIRAQLPKTPPGAGTRDAPFQSIAAPRDFRGLARGRLQQQQSQRSFVCPKRRQPLWKNGHQSPAWKRKDPPRGAQSRDRRDEARMRRCSPGRRVTRPVPPPPPTAGGFPLPLKDTTRGSLEEIRGREKVAPGHDHLRKRGSSFSPLASPGLRARHACPARAAACPGLSASPRPAPRLCLSTSSS